MGDYTGGIEMEEKSSWGYSKEKKRTNSRWGRMFWEEGEEQRQKDV